MLRFFNMNQFVAAAFTLKTLPPLVDRRLVELDGSKPGAGAALIPNSVCRAQTYPPVPSPSAVRGTVFRQRTVAKPATELLCHHVPFAGR